MADLDTLPSSWQLRRLDEISNIIDSLHKTPAYVDRGYPMVRVTDVNGGFLELSETLRVTEVVFKEFTRRYMPKRGDIVFSRVGTYGNASYVATDSPFCLGQNTALISPTINSRFLHFCLRSHVVRHQIEETVVGSTQKTISLKDISSLRIPIPPEQELDAIAHILGTLDDKIALNSRISQTLEAIARAIFKSWFVDPVRAKVSNEPPESISRRLGLTRELLALFPDRFQESELGEIPEGWEVSEVGDVVKVVGGSTPSTKNAEYWDGGTIHWATPKDFSTLSSRVLLDTERKITDLGLRQISSGLLPPGTVLMSSRAPIGYLALSTVPISVNQGFIAMVCDGPISSYYMLHWCEHNLDRIKQRAGGTTFAEISKGAFRPIQLLVPKKALLGQFDAIVTPIFSMVAERDRESTTLANVRDSLLPKLISGELPVPSLEDETL
jgi:type I restriction enzyme S subunit